MLTFTPRAAGAPIDCACPFDPALDLTSLGAEQVAKLRSGAAVIAPSVLSACTRPGETPTVFAVRALTVIETRQLAALIGTLPDSARAEYEACGRELEGLSPAARRELLGWTSHRLCVLARAGMVTIRSGAPDGWPGQREVSGGVSLWTEDTMGGFSEDCCLWLGNVVQHLTYPVDAEKKSGSGSSPTATAGTTSA